jgi:dephospho-CoA kinase
MLKIGLTGGIGSGKSTVSKIFEQLRAPVYYADKEAKRLMNEKEELRTRIVDLLGEKSYDGERTNNTYIASVVFNSEEKLQELNRIVHPAVRNDFMEWLKPHSAAYVVEEAAIIFEAGIEESFDYIVFVSAPEDLRIRRVMERDQVSREQVEKRIQMQWPEEKKINGSDFVITNDINDMLLPQVLSLHERFRESDAKKQEK